VTGSPPDSGEWNTLHGRHPKERRLFSSKVHRGKRAISQFQTIERFKGAAYLKVWLMTGRTHQVRVHCHDHGFSVLGDPLYTPRHLAPAHQKIHKELTGQALHAGLLGFKHPETGEKMKFESNPPSNFLKALGELRSL
jgi:23S rRNA pseudouridine1911/1915/1917 synthase